MKRSTGWEVFLVAYQLPVFGTDGMFDRETKRMLVSTMGGRGDAEKACMKYHPGCRVVIVLDHQHRSAELEDKLIRDAGDKLGGYK